MERLRPDLLEVVVITITQKPVEAATAEDSYRHESE